MTDAQRQYQIVFHTAALGFLKGYRARAAAGTTGASVCPSRKNNPHAHVGWLKADHEARQGGWENAEDIELFAQDEADDYAGDVAHGDYDEPVQPDTPSLDTIGHRFQAGF